MPLLWTSASDVTDRWVGEGPDATTAQIEKLLDDAEDTILREFPDMPERIARDAGEDTSEGPKVPLKRVQKVAARVVMRHLRNPDGTRQMQEGAGPFQRTQTFGGEEPGSLYLTDEDRSDLGGHRRGGAFTIDTGPTASTLPAEGPNVWLSLGRTYR